MYVIQSAVSNEVPEHPCVSPSSNCVFERRLIEKYIAENGTDPISGEQISEEQLIDIKGKFQRICCNNIGKKSLKNQGKSLKKSALIFQASSFQRGPLG